MWMILKILVLSSLQFAAIAALAAIPVCLTWPIVMKHGVTYPDAFMIVAAIMAVVLAVRVAFTFPFLNVSREMRYSQTVTVLSAIFRPPRS